MAKNQIEWCYFKTKVTSHDSVKDSEIKVDKVTWLQMISTALKKSHGVFGEAIEYKVLYIDNLDAITKVSKNDADIFSTAITSFISGDELVGTPLVINIIQICTKLSGLTVHHDDMLWFKKLVETEQEADEQSKIEK
ncbi:unnamed protein product [Kluyveromyces dobzhanskii CBS 2104]|uniref:WGS project CCBQ000000000 data, contig 00014 n=1 Tax=Kluyveromyces dobzhanskii CBS 2104 TaxID=1427455 RepID=A0A0A8L703_9SACH|nr:unnamed protein product [Kluyveromyces dobzhanskii CBS 2104]